ncbi:MULTISPECIES: DUF6702 family protein [Salegentibacter]|jgi:uncharacterized protein YuzE|uniref:Peptidase E n=1 Tax=Salegentibacter agarivorans TaxID=345907 RepID=A0A1I2JYM8_9FLAO|nr:MULTISPECIES: DUF6702 family protein [Salegentibacter]APS39052.1 hypothetical protein AO058_09295 [Salegentibacter sp. T436]SFF57911.1 hypothetical protein SAMN04488033_10139 [Salegentibacter agarivorans]
MRKISLILASFFLLSAFKSGAHEFYLSVTEIEYNNEEQSLQIITRVFIDDFQNVLNERFDADIQLSQEAEEGAVTEHISKYLNQKLRLKIDGEELQLNYLGKEYDADQLVLYIEVENVAAFDEIEVTNEILTDLFDDQKNVVHVKVNNKTKSLLLMRQQETEKLTFP